jgi:hypothetical protein
MLGFSAGSPIAGVSPCIEENDCNLALLQGYSSLFRLNGKSRPGKVQPQSPPGAGHFACTVGKIDLQIAESHFKIVQQSFS